MARHKDTTRLKVICSKLGIEKLFVIQGDEEEVSAFKQKAVDLKAGDCSWLQRTELIKSTWRVSRVPYLLEWEHRSVTDDQGPYTHFANIDDFDPGDPEEAARKSKTEYDLREIIEGIQSEREAKEFQDSLGLSLPFGVLDIGHVNTLRQARHETRLKKNNQSFLEYIQEYGVSKENLHEIYLEDAQILREAINSGLLSEKVFAVSWKTFHADQELQRATRAAESGTGANVGDDANASKKKRKKNRNRKKNKPAGVADPDIAEDAGFPHESTTQGSKEPDLIAITTDTTAAEVPGSDTEEVVQAVQTLMENEIALLSQQDESSIMQEDKDCNLEALASTKEIAEGSGSQVKETGSIEHRDQPHVDPQKVQSQNTSGQKRKSQKRSRKKHSSDSKQVGEAEQIKDDKQNQGSLLLEDNEPLEKRQQVGERSERKDDGQDNSNELGLEDLKSQENSTISGGSDATNETRFSSKWKRNKAARDRARQAAFKSERVQSAELLPRLDPPDQTTLGKHTGLDDEHLAKLKGKSIDDPSKTSLKALSDSNGEVHSQDSQKPFEPKTWAQVVAGNVFARGASGLSTHNTSPHSKQQSHSTSSQIGNIGAEKAKGSHSIFPTPPNFPHTTESSSSLNSAFTFRSQIPSLKDEDEHKARNLEFPELPKGLGDSSVKIASSTHTRTASQGVAESEVPLSQHFSVTPANASKLAPQKTMVGNERQRQPAPVSRHRSNSKSLSKLDEAASEVPEFSQAKAHLASLPPPQSLQEAREERLTQKEEAKKTRARSIEVIRRATERRKSRSSSISPLSGSVSPPEKSQASIKNLNTFENLSAESSLVSPPRAGAYARLHSSSSAKMDEPADKSGGFHKSDNKPVIDPVEQPSSASFRNTQSKHSLDLSAADINKQTAATESSLLHKSNEHQVPSASLPQFENQQRSTTQSSSMSQTEVSLEGQQHVEQNPRSTVLDAEPSQDPEVSPSGQATPTAASSPSLNVLAQELQSVQIQEQSPHATPGTTTSEVVKIMHPSASQNSTLISNTEFEGIPYPSNPEIVTLRRSLLQNRASSTSDLQALSLASSLKASAQHLQNSQSAMQYDELDPSSLFESEGRKRRQKHPYAEWAADMPWRYLDPEESIETVSYPIGTLAYRRCPTMRPFAHESNPRRQVHGGHYDAPAIMMDADSGSAVTNAVFDRALNLFRVWRPNVAAMDLRSNDTHPDWLPDRKLREYQAVETLDFDTWRTDRTFFKCRLPSCQVHLLDHDTATVLCLGCGPQSNVRYCSKEHQLQDLEEHWKECGCPATWFKANCYVDADSFPERFQRSMPVIRDVNCVDNFAKARQRLRAVWNKGQYTLFRGKNGSLAYPIKFESPSAPTPSALFSDPPPPKLNPNPPTSPRASMALSSANLAPRTERLLNIALHDESRTSLVRYLYLLVRLGLRQQLGPSLAALTEPSLARQFITEFGFNPAGPNGTSSVPSLLAAGLLPLLPTPEEDPCECVWAGDSRACTEACRVQRRRLDGGVGVLLRGRGLEAQVQGLEAREWVLRVWRRQHPVVGDWRKRMLGVGFVGVPSWEFLGKVPVRGVGWDGRACRGMVGGWAEKLT